MRTILFSTAALLLSVSLQAPAQAPKGKDPKEKTPEKLPEVRALEVGDSPQTNLKVPFLEEVRTEKELKRIIRDPEWFKLPANKVNFDKERVVFFNWNGSRSDRIGFEVKKDKILFIYTPMNTDDIGNNFRMFVVPASMQLQFEKAKGDS